MMSFFSSPLYDTKNFGHPTCATYSGMGLAYERLFSKLVKENVNYFRYATIGE